MAKKDDSDERDDLSRLLVSTILPVKTMAQELEVVADTSPLHWARLKQVRPRAFYREQPQLLVSLDARPTDMANLSELLRDPLNNPSWDWRETLYTLQADGLHLYLAPDFMIDQVKLTYYRYPVNIDLNGYITDSGSAASTINPELEDVACDQILDRLAKEAFRIWQSSGGFQLAADRIATEERETF
ncbi:hypothetical protein [Spirosoma terrae]|uniref:Uncharacterized protein n=1 Tax=Spirosoma terrae TaxID=1968276 RepID=A0A6L9L545_9BACT|nr:hypothetical protein [Spirosoma terrae]NDU95745.1 hypothetical protein [Spirosoma terrae]